MGIGDFDFGVRMTEAIYKIATKAVDDAYPRPRYATVTAVNSTTRKITMVYPDDATPFVLSGMAILPVVGSVVRVAGQEGTRFVDEIQTTPVQLAATSDTNGVALIVPPSSHVTSERAAIQFGDWSVGQDISANGTKDFYIWNPSATRLLISTTGLITIGNSDESLRFVGDASYISFYNAGSANRRGYLQGLATGLILASESGILTLTGVGGITMSPFTINGFTGSQGVIGNRIVLTNSNGYIYGNYLNMTANIATGWPEHIAGQVGGDNFLRWYNKNGTFQIPGSNQTSGYTWSTQDLIILSGGYQVGITLYPTYYGTAPILRCYGAFGERLDAMNSANTAYVSLNASIFNVQSSERIKKDISPLDDAELLEKIGAVQVHRWTPKVRPLTLRTSARFKDIDARWQASGRTALLPKRHHFESHDHDCLLDNCAGTAENPCAIILNDTPRLSLIAEHLHAVAPEATNVDLEGLPDSYDISQVASMAFGGVGALLRQIKELTDRIMILEAGSKA